MRFIADIVLTYVCNSMWQVPLAGAGAWLAARLLNRMGAKMQYRVWATSMVASVLLPAATRRFPWPGLNRGLGQAHVATGAYTGRALLPLSRMLVGISLSPGVSHLLLAVYGLLCVAAFSRLLFGVLRTQTMVRSSNAILLSEDDESAWEQCRRIFKVGAVEVRSSEGITGPVTCGWTRQILLVPAGFLASCEPDDRLAAFAHEAAHIERKDFLWNTLLASLTLPVAYHPALWLLEAKVAESRELVCDSMAAELLLGADRYATALFRLASRVACEHAAASIHAIGIFDANILEKRMTKLKQGTQLVGGRTKLAIIAGSVVIAGCVASIGSAFAIGLTDAKVVTTPAGNQEVFHVGNGVSAPVLTYSVDPIFPDKNNEPSGFEGVCIVRAVIGRDGKVQNVGMVRTLRPAFDKNAMDAVRQYQFKPGLKDGSPVAVAIHVEVNFRKY